MNSKDSKLNYILLELGHHLPYTIFGVTMGLMLMGIFTFFAILMRAEDSLADAAREFFHVSHASHILLSAVTTTAMFWKHEKRFLKAVFVGFCGSLVVCGLSDAVFPYLGGRFLLHGDMAVHICLIEHPGIVVPFAMMGVITGFLIPGAIEKSTEYSHSGHVLFSSLSAILYLTAFGVQDWIHSLGIVLIIVVFAVMVPCCASGIAFPLFCAHRGCTHEPIPAKAEQA